MSDEFKAFEPNLEIHAVLGDAAERWTKITGVDPEQTTFSMGQYDIHKTYKHLKEAQELDPTGLTAAMLLRSFVEDYAHDVEVSLHDCLFDWDAVHSDIEQIRDIIGVLESKPVAEAVTGFQEWLTKATSHYDAVQKDLTELIADPFELAYIRRDALRAMKKLRAHQFSFGDADDTPISYNEKVLQFWNINSALAALAHSPVSNVSIALIRDAEEVHSYFVFIIRNGGNLIVLTDKEEHDHPKQRDMSRSKGTERRFVERAFAYHFPYQFLEWEITERERLHFKVQSGLVQYNQDAVVLGRFNKLDADQVVWTTIMLSLIREEYWVNGKALPEASFTGEMMARPQALTEHTSNLPAVRDTRLEVPLFTHDDVNCDRLIKEGQWEDEPTKANAWMEKRYGPKVDEDVLNIVGSIRRLAGGIEPQIDVLPVIEPDLDDHDRPVTERNELIWREPGVDSAFTVSTLDPTEFGTAETLQRDAKWHARYNYAKAIRNRAWQEYEEQKEEVRAWVKERIEKNGDCLLKAVAQMEAIVPYHHVSSFVDHCRGGKIPKEVNIVDVRHHTDVSHPFLGQTFFGYSHEVVKTFANRKSDHTYLCHIRPETRASIFAAFDLRKPENVAWAAGVSVEELPIFLQHRDDREPYGGNSILRRLDPMDWVIKNPWNKLTLSILVALSKRGFNDLRKKYGFPRFSDWKSIERDR